MHGCNARATPRCVYLNASRACATPRVVKPAGNALSSVFRPQPQGYSERHATGDNNAERDSANRDAEPASLREGFAKAGEQLAWRLAPSAAQLLHQALGQGSAQPSLGALLTAEFAAMTSAWGAEHLLTLPPARVGGFRSLVEGWRSAQERFFLACSSPDGTAGGGGPALRAALGGNPLGWQDVMAPVLPDPVSLLMAPGLVGVGGGEPLAAWLSVGADAGAASAKEDCASQPTAEARHAFVMQQALGLVFAPGAERRVPPFPPTPLAGWLGEAATRIVTVLQAVYGAPYARTAASPDEQADSQRRPPQQGPSPAGDWWADEDRGLAYLHASVLFPLKDALAPGLGPGLLLCGWLYQAVVAVMAFYMSNASHSGPEKLIICQAVAADMAEGVRVLQAAGAPLADHMALYLASQQLAMAVDLAQLGLEQPGVMEGLDREVSELAGRLCCTEPGLLVLFDAYHRQAEYHLEVTRNNRRAQDALSRALNCFKARDNRTIDDYQEWSDDLSICALHSYWKDVAALVESAPLKEHVSRSELQHLPGAVFLHRPFMVWCVVPGGGLCRDICKCALHLPVDPTPAPVRPDEAGQLPHKDGTAAARRRASVKTVKQHVRTVDLYLNMIYSESANAILRMVLSLRSPAQNTDEQIQAKRAVLGRALTPPSPSGALGLAALANLSRLTQAGRDARLQFMTPHVESLLATLKACGMLTQPCRNEWRTVPRLLRDPSMALYLLASPGFDLLSAWASRPTPAAPVVAVPGTDLHTALLLADGVLNAVISVTHTVGRWYGESVTSADSANNAVPQRLHGLGWLAADEAPPVPQSGAPAGDDGLAASAPSQLYAALLRTPADRRGWQTAVRAIRLRQQQQQQHGLAPDESAHPLWHALCSVLAAMEGGAPHTPGEPYLARALRVGQLAEVGAPRAAVIAALDGLLIAAMDLVAGSDAANDHATPDKATASLVTDARIFLAYHVCGACCAASERLHGGSADDLRQLAARGLALGSIMGAGAGANVQGTVLRCVLNVPGTDISTEAIHQVMAAAAAMSGTSFRLSNHVVGGEVNRLLDNGRTFAALAWGIAVLPELAPGAKSLFARFSRLAAAVADSESDQQADELLAAALSCASPEAGASTPAKLSAWLALGALFMAVATAAGRSWHVGWLERAVEAALDLGYDGGLGAAAACNDHQQATNVAGVVVSALLTCSQPGQAAAGVRVALRLQQRVADCASSRLKVVATRITDGLIASLLAADGPGLASSAHLGEAVDQVLSLAANAGLLSSQVLSLVLERAAVHIPPPGDAASQPSPMSPVATPHQAMQVTLAGLLAELPRALVSDAAAQTVARLDSDVEPEPLLAFLAWMVSDSGAVVRLAFAPEDVQARQLVLASWLTMAPGSRSAPRLADPAPALAPELQQYIQAAPHSALEQLFSAAVALMEGTAAAQPDGGVHTAGGARAHHLAVALVCLGQLSAAPAAASGPSAAAATAASSPGALQQRTSLRPAAPPSASPKHALANACTQLLTCMAEAHPGAAGSSASSHAVGVATAGVPHLEASARPADKRAQRQRKGKRHRGLGSSPAEPKAHQVTRLACAYEGCVALCGEALPHGLPTSVLLAVCQAYLAAGGEAGVEQAMGVVLAAPPGSARQELLAFFLGCREVQELRPAPPVPLLVTAVNQACALHSPPLLDAALQLVTSRARLPAVLQCIEHHTFVDMVLMLLQHPQSTVTALSLIQAWLKHHMQGQKAATSPHDVPPWALSSGVWAEFGNAALQHVGQPAGSKAVRHAAVGLALLCADQASQPQHTVPLRLLAAAAALEADVSDVAQTAAALQQALEALRCEAPSVKDGPVLDACVVLINKGSAKLLQREGRSSAACQASPGVAAAFAGIATLVIGALLKQPKKRQLLLSESGHRAVMALLCEHHPAAALSALKLWGSVRPGVKLSHEMRERLLAAAGGLGEEAHAVQLLQGLGGPAPARR